MKNLSQFLTQVFASKMSIIKGLTGKRLPEITDDWILFMKKDVGKS